MRTSVMNEKQVANGNFRQHSVYSKLVVVLAQAARYVIFMVAGSILLAHNGDVMIGAINSRTHEVSSAGITADVLLIDMLLVDSLRYQRAVRSEHIAAQLSEELHIVRSEERR